jgi:N-glycosidase YbiA
MVAARMGRSRKRPLRKDWAAVKDNIMHEAVLAKFTQHADLRGILLATGDSEIIEHTANDAYWGDGGDGSGKNMLGLILFRVREALRASAR